MGEIYRSKHRSQLVDAEAPARTCQHGVPLTQECREPDFESECGPRALAVGRYAPLPAFQNISLGGEDKVFAGHDGEGVIRFVWDSLGSRHVIRVPVAALYAFMLTAGFASPNAETAKAVAEKLIELKDTRYRCQLHGHTCSCLYL